MNVSMWARAVNVIPRVTKAEWDGLDVVSRWLIATRSAVLVMTFNSAAIAGLLAARDGRFNLHYVYNVADVNGSAFGQPNSALADVNDLAARTGWQEPGVKMECRLSDERSLTCTRADRKGSYQYSRD